MLDFKVNRFSRRCASSDRELRAGETFYSVLLPDGADVVRKDFSAESWNGPPEECVGWWKSEVPDPKSTKVQWAPNEVMLHFFEDLLERTGKDETRYVLTLLLIRRKVFRLENSEDEQAVDVLNVFCPSNESSYEVPVAEPTRKQANAIQNELAELLFARG